MLGLAYLRGIRGLRCHLNLVSRGRHPLYLDYPVRPEPRYGWGRPTHAGLHALLAEGRATCAELLEELGSAAAEHLRAIPVERPADPRVPYWDNGFIEGLDAATLYGFPLLFGSRRYVEIGAGNSTKLVRRAVEDHGLELHVRSIDPHPRAEIDGLCDVIVREALERAPLEPFDELESGDIVMCDGSHRCLQNSDVTVFFLDVLPRLRAGVLVYIDDVYLPCDYPAELVDRHYSEQYVLAALLLGDAGRRYEVVFPGFLTCLDAELRAAADRFWERVGIPGLRPIMANGLWLRVRA